MKRRRLFSAPHLFTWISPLPGYYWLAFVMATPWLLAATAPAGLAQTRGALLFRTTVFNNYQLYPQTSYILEARVRGFGPTEGASPSDSYRFVFGKADPGAENYYELAYYNRDWADPYASDSALLELNKVFRQANGETGSVRLDSRRLPRFNPDSFNTIRVEREGKSGSLEVFLDNAPVLEATDATYQALGNVGWRIYSQAPAGNLDLDYAGYEYLPAGAFYAEAEDLTLLARSGDVYRTFADSRCSGGTCAILDANAAGDFFTYRVEVPQARRYAVKVRMKKYDTRGTFQLAIAGKPAGSYTGGFVNHGSRQDLYAASPEYPERTVAYVQFASAGPKEFRFTITGKNRASRGHTVGIDAITLVPDDAESSAAADASLFNAPANPDGYQPAAFPNPFRERTTIAYQVRETTRVRLVVYDKNGNPVRVLVDQLQPAGHYQAPFEAGNLPEGLYEYRLQTGSAVKTQKVLLVR